MKKILLILSLVLSQLAFSQITLTSADMPVNGDTIRFTTAMLDANVLANYQRGGANQVWDFGSLVPISQTVNNFVSSSQTTYSGVPTDRVGVLFADTLSLGGNSVNDVYNFVNSTSSDFSIDYRAVTVQTGIPLFPTILIEDPYSNKDEIFQFPLDYQDRDSSTFNFVFNNAIFSIYYGSSGYRINDVDGWGSVTTPYGTFNALRVVTDMVSVDSISFGTQNVVVPSHLREYQWIAKGERIPVMKVYGLVTAGIFTPTTVEFRDNFRSTAPVLPPTASFNANSTTIFQGGMVDFNNQSIRSTGYRWDFTPNTITYVNSSDTSRDVSVTFQDTVKYTVRLIASGTFASDTLERVDYITVLPEPVVVGDTSVSFKLQGDTIETNIVYVIKNTSNFGTSFKWEITPTTFKFVNSTSRLSSDSVAIRFEQEGFYSVRLEATDGVETRVSSKQNAIYVRFPVGIQENYSELNNKIVLTPNLTSKGGSINLQVDEPIQLRGYKLYDMTGKLVKYLDVINSNKVSIEAPITSGMYIFRVDTDQGVGIKNLVVE